MALISNAESRTMARDAIVLDLGDLRAQAKRILDQAGAQAEEIIHAARAERDRLIADAEEVGRAAGFARGRLDGHACGLEEGRAQALADWSERLAGAAAMISSALDAVVASREGILEEARDDALDFSIALAEQVARRVVAMNRDSAVEQCRAALEVVLRPSSLVICAHPDDMALMEEAAPSLLSRFTETPHVRFVADASLSRGSALVRTDRGVVEADVEAQIARIVAAVRPAATAPNGARAERA